MSPLAVIGTLLFAGTIGIGAILLLIFFLKRLFAWLDDLGYITYTGHVPTYGSLSNAFMELHQLAEPHKAYVLEMNEELKLKREEDGEAGPDDPAALLRLHDGPPRQHFH